MARGNGIVVNVNGREWSPVEFIVGAGLTLYPGTVVQVQPATALVGGRHTCEVYNADADGGNPKGPHYVLLDNAMLGKNADPTNSANAYAAGERCFAIVPQAGDELNLLVANIAGTADDHTKGEILIIDDGTGKFIATTGSPEREVAQLNETITDPIADTLAWCTWQD